MSLSPGRPRAVDAEQRLALAAVQIYGTEGWAGLSVGSVAKRAGMGKSSLYLRWSTKGELLADAFKIFGAHVEDVDTGSVRSDLIALSMKLVEAFDGPAGLANLRLQVDAATVPELQDVERDMRETQVAAAREIVRRGRARGEVPPGTPVGLMLNAVCGGVVNYTNTRAPDERPVDRAEAQDYCTRLVDLVLRGLGADTHLP
jgi:AcrR family transcriptional regulator